MIKKTSSASPLAGIASLHPRRFPEYFWTTSYRHFIHTSYTLDLEFPYGKGVYHSESYFGEVIGGQSFVRVRGISGDIFKLCSSENSADQSPSGKSSTEHCDSCHATLSHQVPSEASLRRCPSGNYSSNAKWCDETSSSESVWFGDRCDCEVSLDQ